MRKLMIIGALVLMCVQGCRTPTDDKRINVDDALWGSITVVPLVMDRTEDHFLIVQADVTNESGENCPIEYRAEFLNENGLVIRTVVDGWTCVLLSPNETRGVTVVSPTTTATDCRFSIRRSAQ